MFGFFKYTEAKLAKDVVAIIRQIDSSLEPIYHPNDHSVRCGERITFLGNILNRSQMLSRKERKVFLQGFIQSTFWEEKISLENSKHRILPRIKTRCEQNIRFSYVKKDGGDPFSLSSYHLTDTFAVELIIDGDYSVRYINNDMLGELGITFEEAFRISRENLQALHHSPFTEIIPGIYSSAFGDDHDAARILLSFQIESLGLAGNPVAILPAANVLFICGSEDFEALEKVAALAISAYETYRPLSLQPIYMKNGLWFDFIPPFEDSFAAIHNLIKQEMMANYTESKTALEKEHEETELEVFVASYSLFSRNDSPHYMSNAVWTEGVPTWLPKADKISFVDVSTGDGEVIATLDWELAMEHFSDLMEKLDHCLPVRYSVTEFPSKAKLKAISTCL